MKKKIFFGIFIFLLAGFNIIQMIQLDDNTGLTINQLFTMNSAQAEDDENWYRDQFEEFGMCDNCCDGYPCTCECVRNVMYCRSGGNEWCQYDPGTPYIIPGTCEMDGNGFPCF